MAEPVPAHALWSGALEKVVKREAEEAEASHWLHNHASRWAGVRNDWLTVPSIILATATGFLAATDSTPPVITGVMTLIVGILNTLNSYFRFSQRTEGHRIISQLYLKVFKNIQTELALPVAQRTPAADLLADLREKMARVGENAPVLPEATILAFKEKFKNIQSAVPIIANGIDPISIYEEPGGAPQTEQIQITVEPAAPRPKKAAAGPGAWK